MMATKLSLYTKEKALSQENQKSLTDGLTSTKVIDFREQFLKEKSSKTSSDPGLILCNSIHYFIWILIGGNNMKHRQARELWILHTQGKEAIRKHRSPDWDTRH